MMQALLNGSVTSNMYVYSIIMSTAHLMRTMCDGIYYLGLAPRRGCLLILGSDEACWAAVSPQIDAWPIHYIYISQKTWRLKGKFTVVVG